MMVRKSATIQDVARVAGVSTATVSRALSKPALVSDATRKAVGEAVKSTGYRVNRAAQNLRMRRAGAVLVLVPNLGKPFYSTLLSGIRDGFAESDYAVLISDTESRKMPDDELVGYFLDGRIDGVISLDGGLSVKSLQLCEEAQVSDRIVFVCEWINGLTYPRVRSDNRRGAELAIEHLFDLGHRDIAHVTGPAGNVLATERLAGAQAAFFRLGLESRDDRILRGDFSLESGHQAAQEILAMDERPTAVFCAADMVAMGLISALTAAGLNVPNDISVVGFDDIEMSAYYVPALTTVSQDRHKLGFRAARYLHGQLSGGTTAGAGAPLDEVVPVELRARTSAAPRN
jgi:LacI family repressor for deo operon, udp, cdd, tsx, nupC, and nupG